MGFLDWGTQSHVIDNHFTGIPGATWPCWWRGFCFMTLHGYPCLQVGGYLRGWIPTNGHWNWGYPIFRQTHIGLKVVNDCRRYPVTSGPSGLMAIFWLTSSHHHPEGCQPFEPLDPTIAAFEISREFKGPRIWHTDLPCPKKNRCLVLEVMSTSD